MSSTAEDDDNTASRPPAGPLFYSYVPGSRVYPPTEFTCISHVTHTHTHTHGEMHGKLAYTRRVRGQKESWPLRSEKAKLNLLFYTSLCIYSNLRRLGPAEKRPGSFFFRRARKEVAPTKFPAESFNSIMLRANNDPFKLSSHTGLSLSLSLGTLVWTEATPLDLHSLDLSWPDSRFRKRFRAPWFPTAGILCYFRSAVNWNLAKQKLRGILYPDFIRSFNFRGRLSWKLPTCLCGTYFLNRPFSLNFAVQIEWSWNKEKKKIGNDEIFMHGKLTEPN